MPKDVCHQLLYEEAAFTLDRLDVKHEPYESAGRFSPWNLLEFVPSTRPAQAQNGPEMTHWPNPFKPRGVYRRSATDPVYIHASVVNFLTTKGNPITKPKSEKEKAALISACRPGWNETPGMLDRAKNSVASFGVALESSLALVRLTEFALIFCMFRGFVRLFNSLVKLLLHRW
ncbi:hypothetical protein RSAG8_12478, partial [Rhizoctonia solani AG-8 WAC10335]